VTLHFSTGVPNCREGRLNPIGSVDAAWMSEVAAAGESLGYHSLWLNEFLQTEPRVAARFDDPPNYFDPLVTIGYLAASTRRIRFVTSTIVLPHHHPILLNRQVATLDVVSGGRITLGIGLGGSLEEFKQLRGDLGACNRGQMMDEYVEALRTLWTDRKASFSGRFVRFEHVECFPKPLQKPVPIFMAGEAEGVVRRIARFGQGWIESLALPETIREKVHEIHSAVREARGRDEPVEIARQFYISLADSKEAAQANLAASLPNARPAQAARRPGGEPTLVGTPGEITLRLQQYVAAGVTEICAIFYSPGAEGALRQMELFARDVIPAVMRSSTRTGA
jgi:probable F420-dependent oxidoreductase